MAHQFVCLDLNPVLTVIQLNKRYSSPKTGYFFNVGSVIAGSGMSWEILSKYNPPGVMINNVLKRGGT
jgi:hypothetical protein